MMTPMHLPKQLENLGFTLCDSGGIEAIVPPTCHVPPDGDPQIPKYLVRCRE